MIKFSVLGGKKVWINGLLVARLESSGSCDQHTMIIQSGVATALVVDNEIDTVAQLLQDDMQKTLGINESLIRRNS